MKSTGETELKLKTSNARRRVKFKISDRNHLHIVKSYLRFLEERQFKFLFPAFSSQSHNLLKKHVINDSLIADLSKVLQSVTNRYTPLHSLRHTFATNYFINNINKSEQHIIYELANLLGHSDPSVTINNYLHLDFLSFSSSCDY
jgi:integrase